MSPKSLLSAISSTLGNQDSCHTARGTRFWRKARRLVFGPALRFGKDQRGVATVEFVLAFPVLLFLVLMLLQTAMLMVGRAYVHYAAFAATRAAVSQIPADLGVSGGEPRNVVVTGLASPKYEAILRAAVVAVTPVSGRSNDATSLVDVEETRSGLEDYLRNAGMRRPNWVDRLFSDRLRYAAEHTQIDLWTLSEDGESFIELSDNAVHEFGPLDAVTVRVEHDLALSVPYVWRVFADAPREETYGGYATLSARYTLCIDGIDPSLPTTPSLPRADPLTSGEIFSAGHFPQSLTSECSQEGTQ